MKCSNCGEELPKGSLICPRCGTRQTANANSGGNGGNNGGGNNRKNSSGGNGNKKIIGLVAAAVLVVVGVVFGVVKLNKSNNSYFTHNTTFEKDNLSIADENTLRYRDVSPNKSFNVGSEKGYIDVKIVDESGATPNFNIEKTNKNDRYIIKPENIWENTHTYYLSLGNYTYFTDEDMYKFNRIIFTIEKEEVEDYVFNHKIIDTISNPNIKTNVGDVVKYLDKNGKETYGKIIINSDGTKGYEEPSLVELFEKIEINKSYEADYEGIVWNENAVQEFLYDVAQSSIFDSLCMTAYADTFTDKIDFADGIIKQNTKGTKVKITLKDAKVKYENTKDGIKASLEDIGVNKLCKIDLSAKAKEKTDNTFKNISNDVKSNKILELSLGITFKDDDGKLFGKTVPKGTEIGLEFTKKIALVLKYDIDAGWLYVNSFDIQLLYGEGDSIEASAKIKYKALKSEEKPIIDITKGNTELWYKKDFLQTEKIFQLLTIPIPLPPAISAVLHPSVELQVKANLLTEGNLKYKTGNFNKSKYGIEYLKGELVFSKVIDISGDSSFSLEGKINGKGGIAAIARIKIGALQTYPVDLSINAEGGAYFKGNGTFEIKSSKSLVVEESLNIDFNEVKVSADIGASLPPDSNKVEASGTLDLEMGMYIDAYLDGKINIIKPIVNDRVYFFNKEIPFTQQTLTTEPENISATYVGDIGSIKNFGPYSFIVVDKNIENGTALLVAVNGVESKPYYVGNDGINTATLTWANSSLRKYLNGDFLKKFESGDLSAIYECEVKAEDNPRGVKGGEDTTDKVFILSKSELEKYFKKKEDRQLKASNEAVSQGAYVCAEDNKDKNYVKGNTVYWVRNPGTLLSAMNVNSDGSINEIGPDVGRKDICVRPAMWIRYTTEGKKLSERLKDVNDGIINNNLSNYSASGGGGGGTRLSNYSAGRGGGHSGGGGHGGRARVEGGNGTSGGSSGGGTR